MENNKLTGEYFDLVHNLKIASGLAQAPVEVYPWARAYKMAQERKNTFIFSIVRTPEREDKFIWIKKLGTNAFGFYGRKPISQYQIKSIEDAKNWLTVVLRQDLVYETLTTLGFEERRHLIVSSNLNSVFKLLFSGKADFVVTNKHLFKSKAELLNQDPLNWDVVWTVPELAQGYYLAAQLDTDPAIIAKLVDAKKTISLQHSPD
ncbi:hypothetical protein [Planctobacterium marinum]